MAFLKGYGTTMSLELMLLAEKYPNAEGEILLVGLAGVEAERKL